jgi:hypothetical protein
MINPGLLTRRISAAFSATPSEDHHRVAAARGQRGKLGNQICAGDALAQRSADELRCPNHGHAVGDRQIGSLQEGDQFRIGARVHDEVDVDRGHLIAPATHAALLDEGRDSFE